MESRQGLLKGISSQIPLMLPAIGATGCQAQPIASAAPLPAAAGLYAEPQAGAVQLARPALAIDLPTHPCTASLSQQPSNMRDGFHLQSEQKCIAWLTIKGLEQHAEGRTGMYRQHACNLSLNHCCMYLQWAETRLLLAMQAKQARYHETAEYDGALPQQRRCHISQVRCKHVLCIHMPVCMSKPTWSQ